MAGWGPGPSSSLGGGTGAAAGPESRGPGAGASDLHSIVATITVDDQHRFPVMVKNTLGEPPAGVLVLGAKDLTSKGQPSAALGGVAWTLSGGQVAIEGVAGMTADHSYLVTLLVLGR